MTARKRTRQRVSSQTTTRSSKKKTTKKPTVTSKKQPKKTYSSAKKTAAKKQSSLRKKATTKKQHTARAPTAVTKIVVKDNQEDKFTILLEQMKLMQEQNLALAKQVRGIQQDKLLPDVEEAGDASKESMMNKLKQMLSSQKTGTTLQQEQPTINNPIPTPNEEEAALLEKREQFVFDEDQDKPPELKSEPPKVTKKEEEENFQTKKTRGILTMEEAQEYAEILQTLQDEINQVFIGQEHIVRSVVMSLVCDAHTLLEGVPGLAKSLLIEVLGQTVSGTSFERIQFLPDLLPADIIGGQIFNPKTNEFVTHKGPIFANFVLADEINRAPPKTHAAIMEAMQEKKINIANEEFILDRPFLVLATQNPLENKGTYALPEAVLDRFMFKIILDYPKRSDEMKIITENATTKKIKKGVKIIINKEQLLEIQKKVKTIYISPKIREYILDLIEATRGINKDIQGTKFLKYGAGVRASIYLGVGAKANALLSGRNYVLPDDVYAVVPDIFRHRLSLNYRGKAHNISSEKIIEEILSKVNPL